MNSYIKKIIYLLLLIGVASGALYFSGKTLLPDITGVSSTDTLADDGFSVGNRAPQFLLKNKNGDGVSLSSFYGAPVVLLFWATWDRNSTDQIKVVDDYILKYPVQAKFINIIGIHSQEDESIGTSFMKRGGYSIPFLFDSLGEVTEMYSVRSLPTTIIIDGNGIIRYVRAGLINEKMFVEKIENILSENGIQ